MASVSRNQLHELSPVALEDEDMLGSGVVAVVVTALAVAAAVAAAKAAAGVPGAGRGGMVMVVVIGPVAGVGGGGPAGGIVPESAAVEDGLALVAGPSSSELVKWIESSLSSS